VNLDAQPKKSRVQLDGFRPTKAAAQLVELAAPLEARNTAADPSQVKPAEREWAHQMRDGTSAEYVFPPHSFTVIRFE
jgi:alpha-L-arabinofuranosidase